MCNAGDMLSNHIVSHIPASGAVDVSVTASISIVMDDKFSLVNTASAIMVAPVTDSATPMEASSLSADGSVHPGVVAYDKASKTLTFAPSTPFAANTNYVVSIRAGAFASEGGSHYPMHSDQVFSFTTEAAREIELHVEVRGQAQTRGSFRLNLAGNVMDALKAAAVAAVTPPVTLTTVKAFSASVVGVTIPLEGVADVMELQDGDLIMIDI